jgi:hypothetical protein
MNTLFLRWHLAFLFASACLLPLAGCTGSGDEEVETKMLKLRVVGETFRVQRSFTIDKVVASVREGDRSDSEGSTHELAYDPKDGSFSGFIEVAESQEERVCSLIVTVFDSAGHVTGRSEPLNFSSLAGEVHVPDFNAHNLLPFIRLEDIPLTVVVGDSLLLRATSEEPEGGRVVDWVWRIGEGEFRSEKGHEFKYLPAREDAGLHEVTLEALDQNGNTIRSRGSLNVILESVSIRFSPSSGQDWRVGAGAWSLMETSARFDSCAPPPAVSANPCASWRGGFIWSGEIRAREFSLSGTFFPGNFSGPGQFDLSYTISWGGILFGFQDTANYFGLTMGPSVTEFFRLVDGTYQKLKDWNVGYVTTGTITSMAVTADSLRFTWGYLDHTQSAPLPEDMPSGHIGFLGQWGRVGFGPMRTFWIYR